MMPVEEIKHALPRIVGSELRKSGITEGAPVMVAFSGGADSTALLAAVAAAGFRAVALHCNFHLRGDESDRDERFCRGLCTRLGVELKVRHFDVHARVAATGESVEMAARELRYAWFDSEHDATGFPLLTAHHASDNVETFFLNLLRGSGLRGLAAIPPARGYILRPLLGVDRDSLRTYLEQEGIGYVVDSTNLQPDFKRNRLRLETLPALEAQFPGASGAVERSASNLRRDLSLLQGFIDELRAKVTGPSGEIFLDTLVADPLGASKLYYLLDCGLAFPTVERIMSRPDVSGKIFEGSGGVRYLLDRGRLIRLGAEDAADADDRDACEGKPCITADVLPVEDFAPARDPMEMWLDGSVLDNGTARWELRRWRHSDRIAPFGMRGTRAVSSIITEAKVPLSEKKRVWILACDGEPVWIVGFRTSRHFPVTATSAQVVRLRATFPGSYTHGRNVK